MLQALVFTCVTLLEYRDSSMRRYNQLHHTEEETEAQEFIYPSSPTAEQSIESSDSEVHTQGMWCWHDGLHRTKVQGLVYSP